MKIVTIVYKHIEAILNLYVAVAVVIVGVGVVVVVFVCTTGFSALPPSAIIRLSF